MEQLSLKFTEAQRRAIEEIQHNILLISGPGTGKTSVIAAKVAHLLSLGYQPDEILVTTFTNKATDELKSRVAQYCKPHNILPHHLEIYTIHSFCRNIIRDFSHILEPQADFRLLDDIDQKFLLLQHHEALGLFKMSFGSDEKFYKNIFSLFGLFDSFNEHLIEAKELKAYTENSHYGTGAINRARDRGVFLTDREIIDIYYHYRRFMWKNKWLDHSQAMKLAYTLIIKHPEVQNALRKRYRHILVDEYQDTSYLQHEIFRELASAETKIFAVGDDDQGIYQFRGATVHNLHNFQRDFPDVQVMRIEENFRSSQNIVYFTNYIINHCENRFDKSLFSARGEGSNVYLIEGNSPRDTAEAICQTINILSEQELISSYSDVALLFRSVRWGFIGQGYQDIFRQKGIPVVVHRSGGYFDHPIIRFLMETLIFLTDRGKFSFDRFNSILEQLNLSEDTILSFVEHNTGSITHHDLSSKQLSGKYHITDETDLQKLKTLHELTEKASKSIGHNVLSLVYELFALGELFPYILTHGCPADFYQIAYLTKLVQSHENWGGDELSSFVERLQVFRSKRTLEEIIVEEDQDAVTISTIHSAKGLQYRIVIVCDFDPSERWDSPFNIPNSLLKSESDSSSPLDNQHRLFYVALTRAEDYLFLSYSKNNQYNKPIKDKPFITKALRDGIVHRLDLNNYLIESQHQKPVSDKQVNSISVSYTDLQIYASCPLRYQFQSVYGFQTVKTEAAIFGTLVHKVIEKLLLLQFCSETITADVIESIIMDQSGTLNYLPEETRSQRLNELMEMIERYHESHFPMTESILAVEQDFEVFLGDHRLIGAIDLIVKTESDTVEIIDFKTGRLDDSVIDQLHSYALAYSLRNESVPVRLKAHYLRNNEIMDYDVDKEKLSETKTHIIETCERISSKDFVPTPSVQTCSHCPFSRSCPYS